MTDLFYRWEPSAHTADLAIAIESTEVEGLFRASFDGLLGLLEISGDEIEDDKILEHKLTQKFAAVEEGLVDFLNECIYLMDGEELVPYRIKSLKFKDDEIEAIFLCRETRKQERLRIGHIKAATYSNLVIEKIHDKFKAKIIFDT